MAVCDGSGNKRLCSKRCVVLDALIKFGFPVRLRFMAAHIPLDVAASGIATMMGKKRRRTVSCGSRTTCTRTERSPDAGSLSWKDGVVASWTKADWTPLDCDTPNKWIDRIRKRFLGLIASQHARRCDSSLTSCKTRGIRQKSANTRQSLPNGSLHCFNLQRDARQSVFKVRSGTP